MTTRTNIHQTFLKVQFQFHQDQNERHPIALLHEIQLLVCMTVGLLIRLTIDKRPHANYPLMYMKTNK